MGVVSQVPEHKDLMARQLAGFGNRESRAVSGAGLRVASMVSEVQSLILGAHMGPAPMDSWSSRSFRATSAYLVWPGTLQPGWLAESCVSRWECWVDPAGWNLRNKGQHSCLASYSNQHQLLPSRSTHRLQCTHPGCPARPASPMARVPWRPDPALGVGVDP